MTNNSSYQEVKMNADASVAQASLTWVEVAKSMQVATEISITSRNPYYAKGLQEK